MTQMKRRQGVMGPSEIEVYVAHWLNYGVLLTLDEEADPDFVDRALAFGRLVRERGPRPLLASDPRTTSGRERMAFRPYVEAFLRGERPASCRCAMRYDDPSLMMWPMSGTVREGWREFFEARS